MVWRCGESDEILFPLLATTLAALATDTLDDHSVAGHAKPLLKGDLVTQLHQLIALELDQFSTSCAVEMVMLGITIVQLIDGAPIELEALQKSGIDEFTEGSIDRRGTDVIFLAPPRQAVDQLISVEMLVLLENGVNQKLALTSLPESAGLQILLKPLLGRRGDVQRFE